MKFTLERSPLVTLDSVSQYAHVGWGYILVTAPTLFIGQKALPYAMCAVFVGSAIKEYWDAHGLEDPVTAGNSVVDFFWWCVGNAMGVAVLLWRR
jgi:hypothetical protein